MNKLGFALAVLAIVTVATWAYNINYATKTALGRIDGLRSEIAAEREHIQVLRVEWAWLNNPERLARLADREVMSLGLAPLSPEVFERVAAIPYAPADEPPAPPEAAPAPDGGAGDLIAAADASITGDAAPPAAAPAEQPTLLVMAPEGSMMPPARPVSWSGR